MSQIDHRSVTLMIRAKVDGTWARKKATYGKNHRVIPGLIVVGGREMRLPDVSYELRYYEGGKPKYRPAGKHASDAEDQRKVLATQLSARSVAEAAGIAVKIDPTRKTMRQWATEYVSRRKADLGEDQIQRIQRVIRLFSESCKKMYLDELVEADFLKFIEFLRALPTFWESRQKPSNRRNAIQRRERNPAPATPISPRSVSNYYTVLRTGLLRAGVNPKILPAPPQFEEPEVTVYTADQVSTLFTLLTESLRIALSLMLKCGLRRREVSYAYFSDINWQDKTILVRGKPEWKFTVKNRLQRYVPIPDDLLLELRAWQAAHPRQILIVPKEDGQPELRLLRVLKRFVYLYGLRCGRCAHCRAGHPECEDWELHKFRRTYATALVRHVDLRTAQNYLGHKRISSTERYLHAASAADGQRKVSAIDFTKPFYKRD